MSDTKRNMGRGDEKSAPQKKKLRKNHLLVIGIDKYQNGISPLNNAVRDAKDFKSILLKKYQFTADNVKELYDEAATKDAIMDAFDYYLENLSNTDNLIVYFSGHGEIHKITQKGYWIPADAKLGTRASFLSNNEVADFYKFLKAHHVFGIVDSCFSGALFSTRKLTSREEQLDNIPSRWLLTAGRKELVSDGSLGDNSPFAKSLITQLKYNEQNALRVSRLCDNVLDGVKFNTDKQTPRGEPLQNVNHQGGQFVFYAKNFEPVEDDTASDRKAIDPFPTRDTLIEPVDEQSQRKGFVDKKDLYQKTVDLKRFLIELRNEQNSPEIGDLFRKTKDILLTIDSNMALKEKFAIERKEIQSDYNSWVKESEDAKKRETKKYSFNFDRTMKALDEIQSKTINVGKNKRKGLSFNTFQELQFELKKKMVDGLEEAFDEIEKVLDPSSKKSMDLIMAKARYSGAMKNQNLGIATAQQINLTMNQIRVQVGYLIDKMEEDDLKEEIQKALM